jgi:aryl-alcohol dehydrogenase-like predicted oxidoreductase
MGDDPNAQGNSRRWIIAECREQPAPAGHRLHRPLPDPPSRRTTDIDETLGALSDLVHQGKIRAFGSPPPSPPSRSSKRSGSPSERGRERFRTEQPPYSILVRGIERDVLPTAQPTAWA